MSGKSHASRNAAATERRPADAASGVATSGVRQWASGSTTAQPAAGARHAFGGLRVTAGGASPLFIGKPDDAYEIEAERAADRALTMGPHEGGSSSLTPARPGLVQRKANARGDAAAARELPQRIGHAATEGRPLAATQRTFFEQRLGHDFGAVRIHDGPASAAAASTAGAQAFAHGQNIYFGAGEYRPDSRPGQWLIAHELAHTVQQRPNVIARRALDGADPGAAGPTADAQPDSRIDDAVNALAEVGGDKSAPGGQIAKDRLHDLDTSSRLAALGRLQSSVPPGKQQEVAGLVDEALGGRATHEREGQSAAHEPGRPSRRTGTVPTGAAEKDATAQQRRKEGERRRGVGLEPSASSAAASVQPVAERADAVSAPAPRYERATASAAARMRQAIEAQSRETSPEMSGTRDATRDAAGPAGSLAKSDKRPATTGAQAGAGEATALMAAQLGQLGGMRAMRPRFQLEADGLSRDPREALRRQDSEGLAASFVDNAAKQVEAVVASATKFPPQALASLADAKGVVAAAAASQVAAVRDGAAAAHKKVSAQSTRAQAIIEGTRAHADGATDTAAKSAHERAKAAYEKAQKDLNGKAEGQKKAINKDFKDAVRPLAAVGLKASHEAWLAMEVRKRAFLAEKNGESTILDGPYHDDQCDARAEAAEQVQEEYRKSFLASAKEQANKLPANEPEVISKVAEVAKKLDDGLGDQFKKISDGIDAFEKGAKAQSRQTAAKIKSSVIASAAQATTEIDKAVEEQAQQIAAQSESQQSSLDEAAQSAIAAVARGAARACGQMIEAIGVFLASAAAMRPPPREELAPALDQATTQVASGVNAMRAQLDAAGPALAANLAAGAQGASEGLTAAATAVRQGLGQSAESFAQSAAAMSHQASSGFRTLTRANERTAKGIAQSAEDGFKAAQDAAGESFKLFSEKVQETFATGRQQLFDSLWSKETQAKFDKDITDYAKQAADQVQPRWKKVLKWVIRIVIIIAVIAITIASAGSLGPVGIILLGAALGAVSAAAETIATNLIDGRKWSEGVAKAMIIGAVSGAIGGAGGVVLKGVGSVGIRIALDAGVNVIGGVTGEVVGTVATGGTIDWGGAVQGALIGAAFGAGLGIAGALKGKIRFGSVGGEPPPVAPPRPAVEPPGKIRSFLEQTKVLAPRPGAPAPEINVGTSPGAKSTPSAPRAAAEPTSVPPPEPTAPISEPTRSAPQSNEPVPAPRPPLEPAPKPVGDSPAAAPRPTEPVTSRAAPQPAPRTTGEPAPPSPASASESPGSVPEPRPAASTKKGAAAQRAPAADRVGGLEPSAPRPASPSETPPSLPEPTPQGAQPSSRGKLLQFDPSARGAAGEQPQLRARPQPRETTNIEEFAAQQRAKASARPQGAPPSEAGQQVQQQPVAEAAGAEGLAPHSVEPRLQVLEGGAGNQGPAGGQSPVDIRASNARSGPGKPSISRSGGNEPPRPARAAGGQGGSRRAMSGRGRGGQGVIEEMPPAEPTTADKPTPADRREAIAASKERADAKRAAKRQAQQDARSADLERARRDADSAAMQREFQGEYEGPRRNAGSIDEALAADENFGGEAERFGDIGSSGRQPSGDLSELPAFPESVEARGAKKSLDFFNANKDKYPKRIQKQIEAARRGRGSLVDAKKIDAAIKVEQTRAANRELGFSALSEPVQVGVGPSGQPVYEPSSPFTGTSKGHTPLVPGAEYERGATLAVGGRPKNLTYNGQTRTTGEPVQIDDFNFATRTPKEIKMPLALKQDPRFFANNQKTIVDQMRRQAQFAKDWNFSKYKWEMYTPEDVIAAKNIREQLPPDLAKWINITEIK